MTNSEKSATFRARRKAVSGPIPRLSWRSDRFYKHGYAGTPEHRAWSKMKSRCHTETDPSYARYGGRGIKVCAEWRNNFLAFLNHIGPRTSAKHSVDRINNDGNYEPGNVRWATAKEQRNNMPSRLRMIEFRGETKTITAWAAAFNMGMQCLYYRLKYGMSPEEALTKPVKASPWRGIPRGPRK